MINQTRIEKWKNYRKEISKNISLQDSILKSNEKLSILNERLLKVFPEYEEKFKREPLKIKNINFEELEEIKLFDNSVADSIIEKIDNNETSNNLSLQYLDNFDFSSGKLDSLIIEVELGKAIKSEYTNIESTEEFEISDIKKIQLPIKRKDE
ncbi:MAG: hypothetical protein GY679_02610 [Mycoplasma sp.]|nr:hypothetical protein [Mycoplasma sp.]